MKYKIISLFIVFIFIASNVYATPFATIGMQGLSFLNPQIASTVNTALCLSNPLLCLQSKITGYVTGQALLKISQISPQAANAIVTYNRFKGYVDQGAQIVQEIKVNEKGIPESGEIKGIAKNGETAGDLLGLEKKEDAFIQNVDIRFNGEQGYNEITFSEDDGRFSVRNKQGQIFNYINIKKKDEKTNAFVKVDKDGNVLESDFTLTKETALNFPNSPQVIVPQDSRVIFKDNKITIENSDEFKLNINNIGRIVKANKNNVDIFGSTLIGNDFEIDGIRVTGLDNDLGIITIKDEGHLIGKSTIAQTLGLKITGKDEEVLLAKPGKDISAYVNYVKPDEILEFKGNGFSVELQEGNQWVKIPEITNEQIVDSILEGKEIPDPLLKYDMFGGKVQLRNNKAIIETNIDERIIENNGENIITYQDEIREPIIALNKNDRTSVPLETNWKNYKINFDKENNLAIAFCSKEDQVTGNIIKIVTEAFLDITGKQTSGKYCTVTVKFSDRYSKSYGFIPEFQVESIKRREAYFLNVIEREFVDEEGTGPILENVKLEMVTDQELQEGAFALYDGIQDLILIQTNTNNINREDRETFRHEYTHNYVTKKFDNDPAYKDLADEANEKREYNDQVFVNNLASRYIRENIPNKYQADADLETNSRILQDAGVYSNFIEHNKNEVDSYVKQSSGYSFIPVYKDFEEVYSTVESSYDFKGNKWADGSSYAREGLFNAYQAKNINENLAEIASFIYDKPELVAQTLTPNSEFYRNSRYYQQNKAKFTKVIDGKEVLIDERYIQNFLLAKKYNLINNREYGKVLLLSQQASILCSYCSGYY